MTKDEALKLALEALKWNWGGEPLPTLELEAITAIEQALAQPNEFNPDWDAMSVLVEEQQRMAKRIAELEAQQEQEPHSWYSKQEGEWMSNKTRKDHERLNSYTHIVGKFDLPLYTSPPAQRTWVGLTAKEKHEFRYSHMTTADFIEDIEGKLKEKNNG